MRAEQIRKQKILEIFYKSFVGGIGWAAGATLGFTILFTLLGLIFGRLGGLPVVGNFFAQIVDATSQALEARKLIR